MMGFDKQGKAICQQVISGYQSSDCRKRVFVFKKSCLV